MYIIEIIISKKSNIIVCCVYKHPNMAVLDFNYFINQLFDKISKEQKQPFLLGDFNISLLNCNEHQPTNDFLDSLASSSIIPYILEPTKLTSNSKTLIDNIFSNVLSCEAISGNITATILDHLPRFLFAPNVCSQNLTKKILFLITFIKIGLKFFNLISIMWTYPPIPISIIWMRF